MKVSEILDTIDAEGLHLPVFQRGYVWNRDQVRNLMQSLYKRWPAGALLIWKPPGDVTVRPDGTTLPGGVNLLLDGQQRVTSLYGIIRGHTPPFFDGNKNAFTGLRFNLVTQELAFYNARTMSTRPEWISVTDLFKEGPVPTVTKASSAMSISNDTLVDYLDRANRLHGILEINFPEMSVTGEDKTTDVVVEIFNVVNSGGRKLSKGDLALSRISSSWPNARQEMQQRLKKWDESARFSPSNKLDWLLRCVTAVAADASEFESLTRSENPPTIERIKQALQETEQAVDVLLEATRTYLGMDINQVHIDKNAFPAMVKYITNNGGGFPDDRAKAKILYWYLTASIRGRHSGPSETIINQDLAALRTDDPFAALLESERARLGGDRPITLDDFDAVRTNARTYPLLYAMPRVLGARDWMGTAPRLCDLEPGRSLHKHHIFPRAMLTTRGIATGEAQNTFANLAFISAEANQAIGDREPADYLAELKNIPGALESQWVPTDPELWQPENYQKFLEERRRMLAEASNEFIHALHAGTLPYPFSGASGDPEGDEEEAILAELNRWIEEQNLPTGERNYELLDPSDRLIGTLDLAWPNGLQDGLGDPVAVLINETAPFQKAVGNAGYKVFNEKEQDAFRSYVLRDILSEREEETEAA